VLEHRIILRPEFEIEGLSAGEAVQKIIDKVSVPV
jgi:MoxR-like ATPase